MDVDALAADDPWVAWDYCEERGWFLPPAVVKRTRGSGSCSKSGRHAWSFTGLAGWTMTALGVPRFGFLGLQYRSYRPAYGDTWAQGRQHNYAWSRHV